MACACNACSSDCSCSCHGFTSPAAAGAAAARLGRLHDKARDMKARAGLRPWTVAIVRVRYMGGSRRGDGPTEILGRWDLLPIPLVGGVGSLKQLIAADQLRESGAITVSEISNSYTEDQLLGRSADGKPIPRDEVVFYEIAWIGPDGVCGPARRFHIDGAPSYTPASAEWSISLVRAPEDRERVTGVLR